MPVLLSACINKQCRHSLFIYKKYYNPESIIKLFKRTKDGKIACILCNMCQAYSHVLVDENSIDPFEFVRDLENPFDNKSTAFEHIPILFKKYHKNLLASLSADSSLFEIESNPDLPYDLYEYPQNPFHMLKIDALIKSRENLYIQDLYGILPSNADLSVQVKTKIYQHARSLCLWIKNGGQFIKPEINNLLVNVYKIGAFIDFSKNKTKNFNLISPIKCRLSFNNNYFFVVFYLMYEEFLHSDQIFEFKIFPTFLERRDEFDTFGTAKRNFDVQGQITIYLFHDAQTELPQLQKFYSFIESMSQKLDNFPGVVCNAGHLVGDTPLNKYFALQYDGSNPHSSKLRLLPGRVLANESYVMDDERFFPPPCFEGYPQFQKFTFSFISSCILHRFKKMYLTYKKMNQCSIHGNEWQQDQEMRQIVSNIVKSDQELQELSIGLESKIPGDLQLQQTINEALQALQIYFQTRTKT